MCLVIIQGSFFWPTREADLFFNTDSSSADLHHHLKGKKQWDTNRKLFLETVQGNEDDSLCNLLPRKMTAKKLWVQYIGAILAASQHPDDPKFIHEDWTKRLLSELPPSLLQETLQPESLPDLSRILHIVREKLQHPATAPPLRIAVVGGAFAEGEGCSIASVSVPEGSIMANPKFCAWPYRLQAFLNKMLGGAEWVEITNLSEEGTDTGFMIPLMRNWIYPKHLLPHGPDIIINAYEKYDYETYGEGSTNLQETIQSEMSTFLKAVAHSHPCGAPPIVIHMDDMGVLSLEKEHPIFSIHYKQAFDRAMQADRQKDFAMAGHMAMTWVLAFGALEGALRHCDKDKTNKAAIIAPTIPSDCKDPSTGESSCPFAFFASPQGTVTKVTEFQRYLKPYTIANSGWEVLSDMSTGWSRKTGLVAINEGAQMMLKVPAIAKEVQYLHIMTLKSNADPWRKGKMRFRIAILMPGKENEPLQTSFELDGRHETKSDQPEHITSHYNVNFEGNRAPVGSDIMISMELIAGTSFKVLGVMICQ